MDKLATKTLFTLPEILTLFGCMVGPDFKKPAAPQTQHYTENPLPSKTVATPGIKAGEAQVFRLGEEIPEEWWELFHSPKLNFLIEQGFKNNPDLKSARATLEVAGENLRGLIGATMLPAVDADIFGGREQLSAFESLEGTPGSVQSDFP